MMPLFVLLLLPVLIGVASELILRDARKASLAATVAAVVSVGLCAQALAPDEHWAWLAALLVSPLPIAFAVAAVIICEGRLHRRRRGPRMDA